MGPSSVPEGFLTGSLCPPELGHKSPNVGKYPRLTDGLGVPSDNLAANPTSLARENGNVSAMVNISGKPKDMEPI